MDDQEAEQCGTSIVARKAALERIRARLKPSMPVGTSVVDELIADRRAEAARENLETAQEA
jgi:hypothetical protein